MAGARSRNWEALESKVALPDRWGEFGELERKIFLLLRSSPTQSSVKAIADELDLSTPDVQATIDRWQMRTLVPATRVPVGRFLKLIESAAERILLAMDQKRVDGADLKSLGSVFRELINSRALLLGEPTQIVGSDHRRAMNTVVEAMLIEARRRGLEISTDPATGAVVTRRPVVIDTEGRPG